MGNVIKFPIRHWRYEDGTSQRQLGYGSEIPPGWYCWAYAARSEFNLNEWMETHMTGDYDCSLRFNSGDPMYTIYIKEEKDAMFFQLNFGNGND